MGAARKLLAEVNKKYPTLPFSLRGVPVEEKDARLGVTECTKANSLTAFPVMQDKPGTLTACVTFTVLLLPGGTLKVTGLDAPAYVRSDKALPAELAAVRASVPYVKPQRAPAAAAAPAAGGLAVE